MIKNVIITVKESAIDELKEGLLEQRLSTFQTKNMIQDMGLIMGQVEESQIAALKQDPIVESVEEDQSVQLPPPSSEIQ